MSADDRARERQLKTDRRAAALRENLRRRKAAESDRKENDNKGKTDDHEHRDDSVN
jgi:hypothetical protein